MDPATQTELEAAAFRRLVSHLQARTDVQNIDLMNLAGFCRNCMSKWCLLGARRLGGAGGGLSYDDVCVWVYGMAYGEWKAAHQRKATA